MDNKDSIRDRILSRLPEPAKDAKKHRTAGYDPAHRTQPSKKWQHSRPFDPLFRLFSSSGGPRDSF